MYVCAIVHATNTQSNEDTSTSARPQAATARATRSFSERYFFADERLTPVVACRFSAWITVTGSLHKKHFYCLY